MIKTLIIAVFFISLSACGTPPKYYTEPTDSNIARIKVINNTKFLSYVEVYEEPEKCARRLLIGNDNLNKKGGAHEFNIIANKEFAFAARAYKGYVSITVYCELITSFIPALGKTYEISINRNKQFFTPCDIDIVDKKTGENITDQLPKKTRTIPWNEEGEWCQ